MGMFDNVEFEADCKECGEKLTDWESKDGPCELLMLQPKDVDNFYDICPSCGTWNEYQTDRTFVLNTVKLL